MIISNFSPFDFQLSPALILEFKGTPQFTHFYLSKIPMLKIKFAKVLKMANVWLIENLCSNNAV